MFGTTPGCRVALLLGLAIANATSVSLLEAQPPSVLGEERAGATVAPPEAEAPKSVDVRPEAQDAAITDRLQAILMATDWFEDVTVRTREGVVFLSGRCESEQRKQWAGTLARNTEDVVAVVNHMTVREAPLWDFSPALASLRGLARSTVLKLPGAGFALIVLLITWLLGRLVRTAIEHLARSRVQNGLLRRALARAGSLLVMLIGVYVVLYVSGLTRLAVSVLGGTGLIGLVLGIAFRDISENFLASIFLSVQQPFRVDDLVELAGTTGYVQRTTYRVTVLMTLDGNQVQVPNATVYKSVIRNFSTSPTRREDFTVGIGYDESISAAQEIAQRVLCEHSAVLKEPEPWVLVDSLGSATINLRIYFWLDGSEHSWLKVRSSVIRLVKRAFQSEGISMPDEAREIVFPRGVPVHMLQSMAAQTLDDEDPRRVCEGESQEPISAAEGHLRSEAADLKQQGQKARPADGSANLLTPDGASE
jgi:small-conductance mechanosensitive channel